MKHSRWLDGATCDVRPRGGRVEAQSAKAGGGTSHAAGGVGEQDGVTIGVSTDAHGVSAYNPFSVLQWLLGGRTASGTARGWPQGAAEPWGGATRLYPSGNDEDTRGSLEVGKWPISRCCRPMT